MAIRIRSSSVVIMELFAIKVKKYWNTSPDYRQVIATTDEECRALRFYTGYSLRVRHFVRREPWVYSVGREP